MEWIRLIGIVIIVIGFVMKLDTIAVVLIAAVVTGLVSGISFVEILEILGTAFVNNRLVTLFFLTLPMIGLSERFGLKEQATNLIKKMKGLTSGRMLTLYQFIREVAAFFSIRVQGQTQFVRPIVDPMVQASSQIKYGDIDDDDVEMLKAKSAASENFGNFFAQNTFIAASGVLLIAGTMESLGYDVSPVAIASASIPVALIALLISAISNYLTDKKLDRKYGNKGGRRS
ncbi:hypothetical protein BW727_100310 [Jeotgalibaca dankookensis]|uniref:DUF969 domain-containing protein n=1 Tax=Jeotgalibaca dankookensis TaxID=708126 RepID=A0A1S6IMB5_9LACT|nr:DUF969 domain-containing protein [Jeotgalibaca dankookensis]AQS52703.1 hypothetical protein BW727_100310 [Jeotgalibaca dankookensis]